MVNLRFLSILGLPMILSCCWFDRDVETSCRPSGRTCRNGTAIERCETTRAKRCESATLEISDGTEFECKGCNCHDALTAALATEACAKP